MFDIFYKKNNNNELLKYLAKSGFTNTQNFIPLYSNFFQVDDRNFNSINLNHEWYISNIITRETHNNFIVKCKNNKGNIQKFSSFFKFSPLLDPIKFLVGKYKNLKREKRISLPKLNNNICHNKVLDTNNSAYIDSFFSYLTSQLLNKHSFIHGVDFYGSFLTVQTNFIVNIFDDIEYLFASDFFRKNRNKLFKIDEIDENKLLDKETRNYRKRIKLQNSLKQIEGKEINNSIFENIFELTPENLKIHNESLNKESLKEEFSYDKNYKAKNKSTKKSSSTCSSRSSNTKGSDSDNSSLFSQENENSLSSDISDYSSFDDNDLVNATIYDFPVQVICLEKMEYTLDSLLENEDKELTNDEWGSCLFQLIMILITYQKVFDFTHNDLHTNNIMYISTNRRYLNYKYNNIYYRVPTYGRIYKIIDFGRSIYKFKGRVICSDSYHSEGDAATQYNFGPYFNDKKPRLTPNKSFDLCRLACSLFDYFEEDLMKPNIKNPIAKIINEWIKDNKGRNILYKNNREERYPDFKLYKMIVRTVNNHIPEKQLKKEVFQKYLSSKRKIKNGKIINIDLLESMTD